MKSTLPLPARLASRAPQEPQDPLLRDLGAWPGQLVDSQLERRAAAHDASHYLLVPEAVTSPATEAEVEVVAPGKVFLTRSTMTSDKTEKWEDGNEYPIVEVEISSESHPFYTGKQKILDSGGRVARFEKRYGKRTKASDAK